MFAVIDAAASHRTTTTIAFFDVSSGRLIRSESRRVNTMAERRDFFIASTRGMSFVIPLDAPGAMAAEIAEHLRDTGIHVLKGANYRGPPNATDEQVCVWVAEHWFRLQPRKA